jgi:hypothetical protein
MTHYPYLEITLSTRSLGLEKETDTSCQYLLATRHRAGRALKRDIEEGEDDEMEEEDGTAGEVAEGRAKEQAAEGEADIGEVVSREALLEKGGTAGVKGKKRKSKALDEMEQISTKKTKPAV